MKIQEVEAALLTHPKIEDCVVLERAAKNGDIEWIAYVAPNAAVTTDQLLHHVSGDAGDLLSRLSLVPLSTLPLAKNGAIDLALLETFTVAGSDVIDGWQNALQDIGGIDESAVVLRPAGMSISALHLSDLLPDWQSETGPKTDLSAAMTHVGDTRETDAERCDKAISIANPLHTDGMPATLPEALRRASDQFSTNGIVCIQPDDTEIIQSYPALLETAERILAGLRRLGLQAQDKVIFQFDLNQDFIAAYWACILGGFVPIPISVAPSYREANSIVSKLGHAWQSFDTKLVLTSKSLESSIRALPNILDLDNFRVEAIDALREHDPDQNWHDSSSDDLALLLLTSGSTGTPKGVMLSHRNIVSMAGGTVQMNEFTPDDVSLNWMPLDHVGAVVFLHSMCVVLGCQQVHVPKESVLQDPRKWLTWIDKHRASITWAPNFAFSLIKDKKEDIDLGHWDLSCMKFLVNAGETIVADSARQFLNILAQHGLPANAIHPAFGMSETGSGITWSDGFSLDVAADESPFVDLGPPIPGASLRIVDDDGEVVNEAVIGSLQVNGPSVTSGYHMNPEMNQEVFTKDGWFVTGDSGFLKNGRLTLTGREKDDIIINGVNYYPHEIEAVVEEIDGVDASYAAASAVRIAGMETDSLAIFFHTDRNCDAALVDLMREIRTRVVRKIGVNPSYFIPLAKSEIPKTEIGKIQRSKLRETFERGGFDEIRKTMDILTENHNTIPSWFFQKTWRRKSLRKISAPVSGGCVVFTDNAGLGDDLSNELRSHADFLVTVEMGVSDERQASDRLQIDPGDAANFHTLLQQIVDEHGAIGRIVYMWLYGDAQSLGPTTLKSTDSGVARLLYLLQAMHKINPTERNIDLDVITSHAQQVAVDDRITCQKTPALGLLKTASLELPWCHCRAIDFDPATDTQTIVADICQELSCLSNDREIAYRDGKRWVSRLVRAEVTGATGKLPFKRGGVYLISGGLGGTGSEIARYLLNNYDARLLLLGRTKLTASGNGQERALDAHAAERFDVLRELKKLGGDVRYESVDICDDASLRLAVERSCADWESELDGVIHLAGTFHDRLLVDETAAGLDEIMGPKLIGTWNLTELLRDLPGSLFVSFSSVNGFFGGFSVGAYAAASAFLDSFVHVQRQQYSLRGHCFGWSLWDDVGMSRGYAMKDISATRGYRPIALTQGLNSMLAGLAADQTHLYVGLEATNPHIRCQLDAEICPLQQITGFYTGDEIKDVARLAEKFVIKDRFGTGSHGHLEWIKAMPRTEQGAIDYRQLSESGGIDGGANKSTVAPSNDLEKQIASVWQSALLRENFDINDNFFDLGGTSLSMVQVAGQLKALFQREISMPDMFQHPTIKSLAGFFGGHKELAEPAIEQSMAQGAKRRQRRTRGVKRASHNENNLKDAGDVDR